MEGAIKRTRGGGTGALDVFLRQCGGVNSIDLLASLLFLPRRFCLGEANLRRPQPSVCGAPIDEAPALCAVRGGLSVEALKPSLIHRSEVILKSIQESAHERAQALD